MIDTMDKVVALQYEWAKDARAALFQYFETLSPEDLVKPLAGFGGGSIRGLLIHVANTYEFWLGKFAQHPSPTFTEAETVTRVAQVREVYAQVDDLVEAFGQ